METYNRRWPDLFAYHSSWAYTRELYVKMGGYRAEYAGDDGEMQRRWKAAGAKSVDISGPPQYEYNRRLPGRISERGGSEQAYWDSAPTVVPYVGKVRVWPDIEYPPIPDVTIARPW